ncbi:MAG: hypothetical protein Q9192_008932, partial [Flavoplaca navasiana]
IDRKPAAESLTGQSSFARRRGRRQESHHQAIRGSLPTGTLSRERFLLPYVGQNKTFSEVGEVVDEINKEGGERLSTRKTIIKPVVDPFQVVVSPMTYDKMKPDNRGSQAKPKATIKTAVNLSSPILKEMPVRLASSSPDETHRPA